MPRFAELDELIDGTLELPYRGKVYAIAPADADTGLYCQRYMSTMKSAAVTAAKLMKAAEDVDQADAEPNGQVVIDDDAIELLNDHDELELYRRVLGDVWDELMADKVPWEVIKRMALTAFWYIVAGADRAEQYWKSGEMGKAHSPTKTSKSTAAANTTRKRVSTSGTRSRKASPAKRATRG